MPSPVAQNRDQLLARHAQITAQTSARFLNTRQASQSAANASRLTEDQLTSTRQRDRLVRQNQQAMDTQLQLASDTRSSRDDSQAAKVAASQLGIAAYLTAQTQRNATDEQKSLGYA